MSFDNKQFPLEGLPDRLMGMAKQLYQNTPKEDEATRRFISDLIVASTILENHPACLSAEDRKQRQWAEIKRLGLIGLVALMIAALVAATYGVQY